MTITLELDHERPTWALTPAEITTEVHDLAASISRDQARMIALLGEADRRELAAGSGATNAAAWLRALTNTTGPESSRLVKTAQALEQHDPTAMALAGQHDAPCAEGPA